MNTRLDTDPEALDLVRRADPMRDPRVQADAGLDTESALRLLAAELDRPAASGRRRGRRRRERGRGHRSPLRIAMSVGAVAVAAFVVANVASTGHGSAVSPAQAKTLIRHAQAALMLPREAILEEEVVSTVTARDGSAFTSGWHEWLSTSPPYDNRQIIFQNGKIQWEQAFVSGRLDLFDPATNTLYLAPSSPPNQVPDDPNSNSALAEIHDLLGRPGVTVNAHAMLDGAPAIEFTFDGGRFSYWTSASDYQPLQSEDRQDFLPDGRRGVGIDRYPIERVLTGASASPRLLSLQDQHPGVTVDTRSGDYQAARQRLMPAASP